MNWRRFSRLHSGHCDESERIHKRRSFRERPARATRAGAEGRRGDEGESRVRRKIEGARACGHCRRGMPVPGWRKPASTSIGVCW